MEQQQMTHYASRQLTCTQLARHFTAAIQEFTSDGIVPNPDGMIDFVVSTVLTNVMQRAQVARLPWDVVLHDIFHRCMLVGRSMQEGDNLEPGVGPESDIDF